MEKEYLLKLNELSSIILNAKNINEAIHHSADLIKEIMNCERVSIFIYEKDKVWTLRADYTQKIEMPSNKGIVGVVIDTKKPYITNDAYKDKNFNKEIDMKTGYTTRNILAIPILDTVGKLIGVVEFINKKENFNEKDISFGKLFSHYISEPLKYQLGII